MSRVVPVHRNREQGKNGEPGVPEPGLIRNVCLCGQTGTGKTTLSERLLFESGEIKRQGTVEDGNTVS
mgnify:FL=1